MRQIVITIIFNLFFSCTLNAQKWDYQWLFGYDAGEDENFGISIMDFKNGEVELSFYKNSPKKLALGFEGSIINNADGEIILVTNNCDVRDSALEVISGDEIITPTGIASNNCRGEYGDAYGSSHTSIFIPSLMDDSSYYLLHKDTDVRPRGNSRTEVYSDNLWLSRVEETHGEFVFNKVKNLTKDIPRLINGKLTSCPNKDRSGWWIVLPQFDTNIFTKFLVKEDSVHQFPDQAIGTSYHSIGIGQAQYSPDGSMFAINSLDYGILLYDFDNKTGILSNFRSIYYPHSEEFAKGLCFSPNSRFIYVTTSKDVYQIDLENNNEIFHVGHYRSEDHGGWPVSLGIMFSGPDCRIYVSPGSTTYYLHVILEPDQKGLECQFVEKAIETPTRILFNLPNLPQYRYLTGCDEDISFPFTVSTVEDFDLIKSYSVYPNPARDMIRIQFVEENTGDFVIYNQLGQYMEHVHITRLADVDISNYPSGIYFLKDKEGKYETQKFVIIE